MRLRALQVRRGVVSANSDLPASERWYAVLVEACVDKLPDKEKAVTLAWSGLPPNESSAPQLSAPTA
jgi:hypothetical protein